MGKSWVGFSTSPKTPEGETIVEVAQMNVAVSDAQLVAALTTREGIESWIGATTAFTDRRGGNIDFVTDSGSFGGSFMLIDVPRRVILATEVHGEIDIKLDVRATPTSIAISMKRVVPLTEDAGAVSARLRATIEQLKQVCGG